MFDRIMVPLDGSELAECVLPYTQGIAKGSGHELVLLRVVERMEHLYRGLESAIPKEQRRKIEDDSVGIADTYLKGIARKLEGQGFSVTTKVLLGKVAETIIDYANKNNVNLIMIASHGRSGIGHWIVGSVADRVLRGVCIPVMMVRVPGCIPEGQIRK